MRRILIAPLIAGLLAVGGGAFVASSSAFGYFICNGTYSSTTLTGPVVVPKGAFCDLDQVDVTGSIQVQSGGTLYVNSSDVSGSIQSNSPGVNTTAHPLQSGPASFSIILCSVDTGGPVQVSGAPSAVLIGSEQYGCTGNTINENGTNGSTGVSLTANKGPTIFDANFVTGSVGVSSNTGFTSLTDNTITGSLNCTANNPPPAGARNTAAAKNAQCASL